MSSDPEMEKFIKIIEEYNEKTFGTKGYKITIVGPDHLGRFSIAFVPHSDEPEAK